MAENIILRKKICLLGDPAVGKSSLIKKYVLDEFSDEYISTIGTEVVKKEVLIDFKDDKYGENKYQLTLAIWDIIGQMEYRSLISRFFKNAHGALMISDLTRRDTLENLKEWTTSLFATIGKIPLVFVGNKFDIVEDNKFNPDDLLEISGRYGAPWLTTSAKSGVNVDLAFTKLAELMIKNELHFQNMNTLTDVLDAIIVDFCEVHGGLESGMPIFKEVFSNIPEADLNQPRQEVIEELITGLAHITHDKKGKDISDSQQARYMSWLGKVG